MAWGQGIVTKETDNLGNKPEGGRGSVKLPVGDGALINSNYYQRNLFLKEAQVQPPFSEMVA